VRGIKVLVDGIPQTLTTARVNSPTGAGAADRIEIPARVGVGAVRQRVGGLISIGPTDCPAEHSPGVRVSVGASIGI